MTLNYNNTLKAAFDIDVNFRKYIMSTTTLSADLVANLRYLKSHHSNPNVCRTAAKVEEECKQVIASYRKKAKNCEILDIPANVLRQIESIYTLLIGTTLTSSLEDKINLWYMAHGVAVNQFHGIAPYEFSVSDSYSCECLSTDYEDIAEAFSDVVDDIEAWLDIHFVEEFDDYDNLNEDFDDIVAVRAGLILLREHIFEEE